MAKQSRLHRPALAIQLHWRRFPPAFAAPTFEDQMSASRAWSRFGLLFLIVLAPAAYADDHRAAVSAMMEQSGLRGQFANLGDAFRLGITQDTGDRQDAFPAEQLAALADIGERSFKDPSFLEDIESALAETLSAEEIAAVSAFYTTSLGQRIKAAEVAASTAEAQLEIDARRAELRAELEREPERLRIFQSIDDLLHTSEISTTTAVSIARTLWTSILESQSQGLAPEALAALDQAVEAIYPQMLADTREYIIASSAWTYRNLSLEEIRTYADFLQTDEARAAYAALQAGLGEAMEKRGREIGRAFADLLKQQKA
jgi:hypothetical protein